jgi:hypothetical protein
MTDPTRAAPDPPAGPPLALPALVARVREGAEQLAEAIRTLESRPLQPYEADAEVEFTHAVQSTALPADALKLCEEVERLREAVAKHHGQIADDRCWMDDDELYAAFGLPPVDRRVGDKAAMRANCDRFIERRCEGGGWQSYAELEAKIERVAQLEAACRFALEVIGRQSQFYRDDAMLARLALDIEAALAGEPAEGDADEGGT